MSRQAELVRRAVGHPVVRVAAAALLQAAASRLADAGPAPASRACACDIPVREAALR